MHSPYQRMVPGANTAVLFIHGICGTPNHFRGLLPLENMVPQQWSVMNIVLPGHCGRVEDFSHSSMRAWMQAAQDAFDTLAEAHDHIILVGHSMGTLFSIRLALQYPQKVSQLFLIAVPLRVRVRLFGVAKILRYAWGTLNTCRPQDAAMLEVCGITPTKKLWKYVPWIPRMVELIRLMHATTDCPGKLTVPAVAFQSHTDEMVSNRSGKLLEKSGRVDVHVLKNSTHFYYAPQDVTFVCEAFSRILNEMTEQSRQ